MHPLWNEQAPANYLLKNQPHRVENDNVQADMSPNCKQ